MKKKSTRVGIVTGARSDWGLLRPVYLAIARAKRFTPRLFVTGMHLLPEFGSSVRLIDVPIAARIPMYKNTHSPIARATEGLARAFAKEKLDYVIVLGDRVEMLAGALAALERRIPIVHIHGGDAAQSGHQDEMVRPVISTLASVHCTASKQSGRRLLRHNEEAWRITVTGSPALDAVRAHRFSSRTATKKKLGIATEQFAVVIFHPHDRNVAHGGRDMRTILTTLRKDPKRSLVIIYPNNDRGNEEIIRTIESARGTPNIRIFKTMPQSMYLDLLRHAEFLVGNSSGAMYECSFLETPAINVGLRNRGREHGANVLDADASPDSLSRTIAKVRTHAFRLRMKRTRYLFGNGHAAEHIAALLQKLLRSKKPLLPKTFAS